MDSVKPDTLKMDRHRTYSRPTFWPFACAFVARSAKGVDQSIRAVVHAALNFMVSPITWLLASFAYPLYTGKLVICYPRRPAVAPRRTRRGATVFGVSLALLICTGILSLFLQSYARELRQQSAINTVDIIAAHAANLDFWVNDQSAPLDSLITAGGGIVLSTAQITSFQSAETTNPFQSSVPRDWQFHYLVSRPTDEADLFGILIAQPQTAYTRTLSDLAQPFLSERIGAAQLGGGTDDTLDARTMAAAILPGGLATSDIALYSYKLNETSAQ